jgi:hypothetical protein
MRKYAFPSVCAGKEGDGMKVIGLSEVSSGLTATKMLLNESRQCVPLRLR